VLSKLRISLQLYKSLDLHNREIYRISQTTNLIINLDHDEWILEDRSKSLSEYGLGLFVLSLHNYTNSSVELIQSILDFFNPAENESEVSLFNRADYEAFKANPQQKW
jgi:hypothetical protein